MAANFLALSLFKNHVSIHSFNNEFNQPLTDHSAAIVANFDVIHPCLATNDARINITSVSGGKGSYVYSWYKNGTLISNSQNISQITGALYSVSIGDGSCSFNFPVIVTAPSMFIQSGLKCIF